MKTKFAFLGVLLGLITAAAQPLFIDFSNQTTPLAAGYQAYRATHEVANTFSNQSFSAFSTTVSIRPTWDQPTYNYSMQMIDRGVANTPEAADLLRDWIGTDNRVATGSQPTPGFNHMTLTITGLPAGTYRWLSYHHDPNDQTGIFHAYVVDAKGTNATAIVDISNTALPLANVTRWVTTITSDGVNPVRLRFMGQSTSGTSSFFVMNGFELTFLGLGSEWASTGGGNWSDAGNWDANGVPNGPTSLALFGGSILAPSTVNVNVPVALVALSFGAAQSYTLAGPNTITLASAASLSVDSGSHTIAAALGVSGGEGLTIAGAGELTLSGANTYTGPTVVNIPTLNVTTLANGGSPSSVGASSSDAANLTFAGTLRYTGSGHTSDRLFTLSSGTRTLDASGSGALNLVNPGALALSGTGARTLVLSGTNTGNNTLTAVVPDAGFAPNITSITKSGPGKWVLAGANTCSGNVTINDGTLALAAGASLGFPAVITVQSNAVLDASAAGGLTLAFGQVLQGSGSVVGNVTDGASVIRPGGAGTMGTLVFANGLYLAGGNTLEVDLGAETTVGGGVNDLIVVHGDLDLSFVTVQVNFTGVALGNSYRLINYQGNLLGTPNVTITGLDTTRYSAVVSTGTAGQVNLVISGTPAALTWVGDGVANLWDLQVSPTWNNPATSGLDSFRHLDNVVFDNTGSTASNVDLVAIARPGSVTVNSIADYNLGGTGRLSGAMSLIKAGSGTLTLSNANNFTGTTTVSGGILRVANNAALGTSAGGTVIESGATLDVFGFQTSADHITVSGSGVGGQGAIINTRAEQQSAIRLLTLAGDTYVKSDFRWDVRGAGGNGSFSGLFDLGGYTFSRAGTNRIAIVDSLATNAGNIVIIEGGMSLTRSYIEGPGYIDVGTNFLWIENSPTGRISKPMVFAGGRLQCSGNDFVLDSSITNVSGLTVDNSNTLTISNTISGGGWLSKTNGGVLRLEAANTYAGDTTIIAGTLALGTNGTIGSGATITLAAAATFDVTAKGGFTAASGKTFIGGGTVNGGLTVASGATLQVATPTSTGTLTVLNGNATLGGGTFMKVNATTKATDSISTTNALNLGGTLTVDNLGGTFAGGDTFKLFNAPVLNGSFSQTLLPPLSPGQIWLNKLSVDGTIAVADLLLVTTELPGGFWQFTWDTKLNGLVKVQAQTNALDVGISTNWSDYPNGTFNGVLHVPSTSNPSVFFRLSTQ